jgi:hypothetical protein
MGANSYMRANKPQNEALRLEEISREDLQFEEIISF